MNGQVSPPPRRWPLVAFVLALALAVLWWLRGREAAPVELPADAATADRSQAALTGPRARAEPTIDLLRSQRASITGTVTDLQHRPLVGAQVCATAYSQRLASSDTRRAVCTTSGKAGQYRLDQLFPVRHMVVASAAGHIPARFHRGEGVKRREYVELRAAQETPGVDIQLEGGGVEIHGTVKDLSGGAIEGAQVTAGEGVSFSDADGHFSAWVRPGGVWLSAQADGYAGGYEEGVAPGHVFEVFLTPESVLIGKVVRAGDGSPVEGARVLASANSWGYGSAAFTDASGAFRIDGLQPGPYKPRAESDDTVGQATEQTILGLGETSAAIVVTVHPAFYVEGAIVVAGGGDSCDRGELTLNDKAANRSGRASDEGDGVMRVRGLLPGDYEVWAGCDGFVPEERHPHVIVADHSVTGLRWQVSTGQTIRGVVLDGGKPVPRVSVYADAKSDPNQPRAHQTETWGGQTDERGGFELAGLLPGRYTIGVSAYSPPRATPPKPIEVTLPKGQDLDGVKIDLPATGEVKGHVRDEKGQPIPKLQITLNSGVQYQYATAADDGSFSFPHVAAGEYRVMAQSGWNDIMRAPGTSDDDLQGEKVSVRAGSVESVALVIEARSSALSGVVRDADGGPVADAFVEATRESTSATKAAGGAMREGRWGSFFGTPHLTDQDGRFTLEGLAAAPHTVRAHRKGGGEAFAEHVEPGGDLVLTIAGTGRMSGTITAPGGAVPEDFTVSVTEETTGFRRYDSFFRTRGEWSLPELPAGKYKVKVSAGSGVAELEASMAAGQDTTGVRVELAPKVTVRGTVVDLEGKPVAGMEVSVSGANSWGGGDQEKRNITDATGRYEVQHAPTGKVTVRVSPRNWQDGEHDHASMPAVITASGDAIELPPIRVSKRRLERDEVDGDFGHSFKEPEPGADPMLHRLVVAVVRPGSPAAAAGLKPGDEVIGIDGQDVTGANTYLMYSLTRVPVGTVVNFGLAGGASLAITAGPRP